jgi:arylsulfatase A-like enzyme
MLSGRYQNRFGFESNEWAYHPGMPLSVPLVSERLKQAGYATGYIGKWGITSKRYAYPPKRGFDESYWVQDGNVYFPNRPSPHNTQMHRGMDPIELDTYSTDAFGREAIDFIERHEEESFFLFISYITPHEPMEAKASDLERFAHIEDPLRRTTLAMIACLDDNVGNMLRVLEQKGLDEDTLIFFISDNGGYPGNASLNTPYRGRKSQMLEGGIHVPFLMQWKGTLPAGQVYDPMVSSLDIVPTCLELAGIEPLAEWQLDGVNLLPYVLGHRTGLPHQTLFWRYKAWSQHPEQDGWAIRMGDWMLVRNGWAQKPPALYNLQQDPQQLNDLSRMQPERMANMRKRWEAWDALNVRPGSMK